MDIYFVRHGQTDYNRRHVHQPIDAPLDELGRSQAAVVAQLLVDLKPTHLISSPLTRTYETATIINETLKLELTTHDAFAELRRPAYIRGYRHFGLRSLRYIFGWFYSYKTDYDSEEAGESRLAFLHRITRARDHLETYPHDARIVVVSHSVFINFFVRHICDDKPVSIWKAVLILLKIKTLDNSSITHVVFDPTAPDTTCKWNVVSFDQDEHVRS